jgi:hypothetical protein
MSDERQSEELVEDLDVPAEEGDQVKGGSTDGTSNTIQFGEAAAKPSSSLQKACATGQHYDKVTLRP